MKDHLVFQMNYQALESYLPVLNRNLLTGNVNLMLLLHSDSFPNAGTSPNGGTATRVHV